MRLNNPQGMKGSFGMPAEAQEAVKKVEEAKAKPPQEEKQEPAKIVEDWPLPEETELPTDETSKQTDPMAILKRLGVEATEEDFHNMIFRGYIEKVVPIQTNPLNKESTLEAKLRLLTAEEAELVDELVAEELDNVKMTNTGLDARRASWILAFAVQELFGRPIVRPVMKGNNEVDLKETAKLRRKVLLKMNASVLNRISWIHAQLFTAFDQIQREANSDFLKKF